MDLRVALVSLLLACDPSITVSSGSVHQVSWDAALYTRLPALLVVTIDDGADANATAVRAKLTHDGLTESFDMLLEKFAPWPHALDPASGFMEDVRVVVVHPRSGAFVTPLDDPSLRFSATATQSEMDATADAVITHAQENIVAGDAFYPLITRTRDVLSLLLRERPPRDAREQAIVASMPEAFRTVTATMLTSRDDNTRGVTRPALPPETEAARVEYVAVVPCTGSSPPSVPVLNAWTTALNHEGVYSWVSQPACGDTFPIHVFAEAVDYSCVTISANDIARDADGAAECSITFDSFDLTQCDPARGWADPIGRDGVRRPTFDVEGATTRRCEILQLTGDARASCEHSVACEGCSSGFCVTSLLDNGACPNLARFVDSSLYDPPPPAVLRLHFTCNLR